MRNHPSLSAETREKIRAVAEEIGYRPNPLVAALMTQLRGRRRRQVETIALIGRKLAKFHTVNPGVSFYRMLHAGIQRRAAELGLAVDSFELGPGNPSCERLTKILLTRGIHGLLLLPGGALETDYAGLAWEHFASVEIGYHGRGSPLHQVVSDYTHDIDLALDIVRRAGIMRLGFAVPANRDRSIDSSWSARFLLYQQSLPSRARIPFIRSRHEEFTEAEFFEWVHRHHPEAILVAGNREYEWIRKNGSPEDRRIRVINLVQRGEPDMAGIDPRTEEVGSAAVELLTSLLQANQFGLPEFPRLISVKGKWISGPSFEPA